MRPVHHRMPALRLLDSAQAGKDEGMASGRVHSVASLVAAIPAGIAAWYLTADIAGALAVMAGCASGVLIMPDLDTAEGKTVEAERIAGKVLLLGGLWSAFWWPYSKATKHRSGLSHTPGIGTLGRLLYLAIPLLLLAWWQGWTLAIPAWLWPWAAGLAAMDCLHWIMDGCPI